MLVSFLFLINLPRIFERNVLPPIHSALLLNAPFRFGFLCAATCFSSIDHSRQEGSEAHPSLRSPDTFFVFVSLAAMTIHRILTLLALVLSIGPVFFTRVLSYNLQLCWHLGHLLPQSRLSPITWWYALFVPLPLFSFAEDQGSTYTIDVTVEDDASGSGAVLAVVLYNSGDVVTEVSSGGQGIAFTTQPSVACGPGHTFANEGYFYHKNTALTLSFPPGVENTPCSVVEVSLPHDFVDSGAGRVLPPFNTLHIPYSRLLSLSQ